LTEGVRLFNKDWKKIAEYVGEGTNGNSCSMRWKVHLDPELQNRNKGPWTEEEVS
jgi:hypothetical protein